MNPLLHALALGALALPAQEVALEPPPQARAFVDAFAAWIDEAPKSDVETARAFFTDEMRAALSVQAIEGVLAPMRDTGAARISVAARNSVGAGLVTWTFTLEQDHSLWTTDVTLDSASKVTGWYVYAAPRRVARAELEARVEGWKGDWGLALALLDRDGKELSRVDVGSEGSSLLPLGSIFKLYVLAELARQCAAGERSLDDDTPIEDSQKSLPSGEMQNLENGTRVTLRRMAQQMIAISDNTAADHLLELVGREKVEAHLGEYKNSDPARNTPFLSTLEMFVIKGVGKSEWQAAFGEPTLKKVAEVWKEGDAAKRRAWLAALHAEVADEEPAELRGRIAVLYGTNTLFTPGHVAIEWLAKPRDIVELVSAAQRGTLVDEKTSKTFLELYRSGNRIYRMPGVVEHGFKGGSETSVFALSTRVVLADGRVAVGCICRSGFPALDAKVSTDTLSLFLDWIRNLFEGDPPKPADGAAK